MPTVVITPAQGLALELDDVRAQCRGIDGAEDAYITGILIPAACRLFEQQTRHRLLTTELEDQLPAWPRTGRIDLGWGRLQEVVSVSYLDADGQLQALPESAYQVSDASLPAEVHRAPGVAVPSVPCHPAAWRVRYVAGLADDASGVPPNARLWLLLHVAHFWANREAAFVGGDMKPLLFADSLIAEWSRAAI